MGAMGKLTSQMAKTACSPNNNQPLSSPDIGIQHSLHNQPIPYLLTHAHRTNLISSQTRTKHRPHNNRINIPRQNRQIIPIQHHKLLKTPILMMQMVRPRHTILLRARETELATATHAAGELDAHEVAYCEIGLAVGAEGDDAADAFVAADVGEFDGGDGGSVGAGGGAVFGVEVYIIQPCSLKSE